MADFETRVEALTGLTVSTNPTTAELTEYLKDGVIEITNRITALKPEDIDHFSKESSEQIANNTLALNGAKLLAVLREDGIATDQWRPCRQIPISSQYLVTDIDSLSYASKINPAFMVGDNGKISVFPAPADAVADKFKAYYVNNIPVDKSGASLLHSHSDIGYFPDDKVYLVVIYAGIKSLTNALAAKGVIIETSLSPDNINLPVPPTAPSIDLTAIDASGITNPTFQAPVLNTPDWSDTNNWISVEEDSEMLSARVNEINSKIQEYGANLQSAKNKFDEENAVLQKDLSLATQNAQSYEKGILTKYAQEILEYEKKITALIQKFIAEVQKANARLTQYKLDYDWMFARVASLQREYDTSFMVMVGRAPQQRQQQNQEESRKKTSRRRRR